MPKEFDDCVRALVADPDFKPRKKGQTKKDAAYAVCTSQYKKRHGKSPFSNAELTFEELYEADPQFRLAVLFLEMSLEE